VCVHTPFRLNPIASLAWLRKQLPPALCFRSTSVGDLGYHALCKKSVHTQIKQQFKKIKIKSTIGVREGHVHGLPVLQAYKPVDDGAKKGSQT
jgi:hypothetical protein